MGHVGYSLASFEFDLVPILEPATAWLGFAGALVMLGRRSGACEQHARDGIVTAYWAGSAVRAIRRGRTRNGGPPPWGSSRPDSSSAGSSLQSRLASRRWRSLKRSDRMICLLLNPGGGRLWIVPSLLINASRRSRLDPP